MRIEKLAGIEVPERARIIENMVEQSAVWVDFVLDTVAGPAPARRGYRDRVPGIGRALEWSRHRSARGAIR